MQAFSKLQFLQSLNPEQKGRLAMSMWRRFPVLRWVAAGTVASGLAASAYVVGSSGILTAETAGIAKPAPAQAIGHATALSEAFRHSADMVMPAVVSIHNETQPKLVKRELRAPRGGRPSLPDGFPKEFGEMDPLLKRFFEQMPEGGQFDIPETPHQHSSGTGVIIDPTGVILTNNHVVAGGGKITVRLHDGREFVATEVKTDPNTDIAIVKIKADKPLPTAKLGDSDAMQIGDWVLALGQPFGLTDTVTAGIVSAKGRDINITKHAEFIQTDAAINPGNSGGPLVNLQGEVIGINTAISSSSGGFQGVGFAVPVNVAKWVSTQLLADGKVHRAYLGIGIQPLDSDLADQLGAGASEGAVITEVQPNSPAAAAGLQPQDVVVEFGGAAVHSPGQLSALAGRTVIGSKQPMVVIRDGKRLTLHVTVKEQPKGYGEVTASLEEEPVATESAKFDRFGLEVAPLTADVAKELNLKSTDGVVITGVEEGSPAANVGLETSMVVAQVGKMPVHNVDEFNAAMANASPEKGVLLLVRSAQGSRFVVLKSE
jgi:serine protease Do